MSYHSCSPAKVFFFLYQFCFSLGAEHDGDESARPCPQESMYIMTAYDVPLSEKTKYSLNPYRFSQCSVTAFKTTINALR